MARQEAHPTLEAAVDAIVKHYERQVRRAPFWANTSGMRAMLADLREARRRARPAGGV